MAILEDRAPPSHYTLGGEGGTPWVEKAGRSLTGSPKFMVKCMI